MAHAAGGCAVGALQKQCEAGAIGAVVGEVVAELLPQPNINTLTAEEYEQQRQLLIDKAKLATAVVTTYAGYDIADINTAVKSAETAVENNHNGAEQCDLSDDECKRRTQLNNTKEAGNTSFKFLKQVFENIVSPNSKAKMVKSAHNLPKIDKHGRLHGANGRYIPDPNNPKISTTLSRPYLRVETLNKIRGHYERLSNGNYRDKRTRKIIKAPVDIGHIPGREHRRLVIVADELGMTQTEFNEYLNARPNFFQLENYSDNRSHANEKPGNDIDDALRKDMKKFVNEFRNRGNKP